MKRKELILGLLVALGLLLIAATTLPWVKYTPYLIDRSNGQFSINEAPELDTQDHRIKFCHVLDREGEAYWVVGGYEKVRINLSLAMRKDKVAIYTRDAARLTDNPQEGLLQRW